MTKFLIALGLDVAIETGMAFLVIRQLLRIPNLSGRRIAYTILAVNVSSLPYLWLVLPAYIKNYLVYLVVGEMLVFFWETIFYRMFFPLTMKEAALLSFMANGASLSFGSLIFQGLVY